jgi:hypothetical protein
MGVSSSLPQNHFKSDNLASVYGSLNIILPSDFNPMATNATYTIQCRMTYLGFFRNGAEFIFSIPCTYDGQTLMGTITMPSGQIFSINVQRTQYGSQTIFNGTYVSQYPGDTGRLHYEM